MKAARELGARRRNGNAARRGLELFHSNEFRDEFFDEEGFPKCGNGNVDLVKALLAGWEILREG